MQKFIAFFVGIFMWAGSAYADVPAFSTHVNDTANLLTAQQSAHLNRKLAKFEAARPDHPQIAILTVRDLPESEDIASYANTVFRAWGLGQKGLNNGVLIVVSCDPKKIRIEVGRGLEGDIADIDSIEIIDAIKPSLKANDFAGAFETATAMIIAKIPPAPKTAALWDTHVEASGGSIWFSLIIALAHVALFTVIGAIPFLLNRWLFPKNRRFAESAEVYPRAGHYYAPSHPHIGAGAAVAGGVVAGVVASEVLNQNDATERLRRLVAQDRIERAAREAENDRSRNNQRDSSGVSAGYGAGNDDTSGNDTSGNDTSGNDTGGGGTSDGGGADDNY